MLGYVHTPLSYFSDRHYPQSKKIGQILSNSMSNAKIAV
jgi:hypothetical protein